MPVPTPDSNSGIHICDESDNSNTPAHKDTDDDDEDVDSNNIAKTSSCDNGTFSAPSTSTKQPLQLSRKRQADEEYQLIKGLATSISQRNKRKQKSDGNGATATFGHFVAESLSDLDPVTRTITQHEI